MALYHRIPIIHTELPGTSLGVGLWGGSGCWALLGSGGRRAKAAPGQPGKFCAKVSVPCVRAQGGFCWPGGIWGSSGCGGLAKGQH